MNENVEFNFCQPKKENNNKIVYLILIGVIVIGLIVGAIFLAKGNKDDKNDNQVENKETTPTEPTKPENGKVEVDVEEANKKLVDLNVLLHFTLDYKRGSDYQANWFKNENIVYEKELLSTEAEKNDFVFGAIFLSKLEKDYIEGKDYNGNNSTGSYAIRKTTFVKTFEGLLGVKLPDSETYPSNNYKEYKVYNTYLYGAFWSGWTELGTILKYNSFINNGDGTFTLIIDVLSGYDASDAAKLADPKLDSGYDKFITSNLKLELVKLNGDLYSIKSMQFVKLEK